MTSSPTNGNGDRHALPEGVHSFGPFRVIEQIGGGGQGIVFKAAQPGTNRPVALKVLRDGLLASGPARHRFETEIQTVARLNHPNIVSVYECGQDRGHSFYAMELIDGVRIDESVLSRNLSVRQTVDLFLQVCDAVAYAHQQGVIHRDLKPANILVDADGRARLLDFGLAKLVDRRDREVTATGVFTGNLAFAAPEQLIGSREVDVRTDIYTLGLILYRLLTGTMPYDVDSISGQRLYSRIMALPLTSPAKFRREVSEDLATIVLTALKKEPADRYQSASAMVQDLRRYLAGRPIEARRDSRWYLLTATARYYKWALIGVGAAVAVLLAFAITVTVLYTKARTAQATAEARAAMSRMGQHYLFGKMERFYLLENMLNALSESHPDLPAVRRASLPPITLPDELRLLSLSAPKSLFTSPGSDGVPTQEAEQWLEANRDALDAIAETLAGGRLQFGVQNLQADYFPTAPPEDSYWAVRLVSLFVARAMIDALDQDLTASTRHIRLALHVRQDLATGHNLFHQGNASSASREVYGSVLRMLAMAAFSAHDLEPLLSWSEDDARLPPLGSGQMIERIKAFQLAEAALVETFPGGEGHLDLDLLDKIRGGYYAQIGYLTPENRAAAKALTPREIIHILDTATDTPEKLRLDHHSAGSRILGAMMGRVFLKRYAELQSLRAAAHLATRLCRFRADRGRWPEVLAELGAVPNDPLTGLPFGYAAGSAVLLYSLNTDGLDQGGTCGVFNQPDTDLRLFEVGTPPEDACPILGVHRIEIEKPR